MAIKKDENMDDKRKVIKEKPKKISKKMDRIRRLEKILKRDIVIVEPIKGALIWRTKIRFSHFFEDII